MKRHLMTTLSLLLLCSLPLSGATCSQKLTLPTRAPTAMVITVPPGSTVAATGRAAIWKYVPKGFQPAGKKYRFLTLSKTALPKKMAEDTYQKLSTPPWGIKGYT